MMSERGGRPAPASAAPSSVSLIGLAQALGAFVWWGVAPIYFKFLIAIPALTILAHRVVWSVVLLLGIALTTGRRQQFLTILRTPPLLGRLALSGLLIGCNWGLFVWSVNDNRLMDASLGYYINPLINVVLGLLFLGEKLTRLQTAAVALAAAAVLLLVVAAGHLPWVALSLALTFGFYGLIRKTTPVDALTGLLVETLFYLPLGLAYLLWQQQGALFAPDLSVSASSLLMGLSIITVVPLVLFAAGARKLPYATVGLAQYIAPSMQFLLAVLVYGEAFSAVHGGAFALIWSALALYSYDLLSRSRSTS